MAAERVRRMGATEWRLLLEAAVLLTLVSGAIRIAPYRALRRWFTPYGGAASSATVSQIAAAVQRAGRRVPGTTCLVEALVAERMLRRRGHPAIVHCGVRHTQAGDLDAHAWVECNSVVVIGGIPIDYRRLTTNG